MNTTEVNLSQQHGRGAGTEIKLIDKRELQVTIKSKKNSVKYSVDILSLENKSKRVFYIAWKWLISSIVFLLVTLILLKILPFYIVSDQKFYLGIILFSGLTGFIVCFILFFIFTSRKQVFYSRSAHVPIIKLDIGKPAKKEFNEFIHAIEKRIKQFRKHMDISEDKQLTGEMKMLRRLSEQKIITTKDYGKAKEKLFSGFSSTMTIRKTKIS